ncbi:MAG: DUF370 domain-containing protein [Deltaproteobacteria bacterium]|nr:DUF370 domain-containing protein [Deltaproteobacteria bacterium]
MLPDRSLTPKARSKRCANRRRTSNRYAVVDLLNVGFGNVVVARRVVAIVSPASAPVKRIKEEARLAGKLVDATQGRKTRAIVITDSDHVVLSAIQVETVAQRLRQSPERLLSGAADTSTVEGKP